MADSDKRVPENVPGDFFVDTTCIDCDACRQIAPAVFGDAPDTSYVYAQPATAEARRDALRALLACPTGSIGTLGDDNSKSVLHDFPLTIEPPVSYCGFNSRKSYGGNSYFVEHPEGNWLIDSPKFTTSLVETLARRGGIHRIFLTHSDDVADADKFAAHFGADRIIHREELASQPDAEIVVDDFEPLELSSDFVAIPTPGHTAGHLCLLFAGRFLFTGDHLAWDRAKETLTAFRDYCWDSWPHQVESMRRLAEYNFEWVLPGHGQRIHLPANQMSQHMQNLVARMSATR
jgi:glyoxylase-like metal-dependent hydrolase (beta-lactamase superfamily II)/ferredoxin